MGEYNELDEQKKKRKKHVLIIGLHCCSSNIYLVSDSTSTAVGSLKQHAPKRRDCSPKTKGQDEIPSHGCSNVLIQHFDGFMTLRDTGLLWFTRWLLLWVYVTPT